MEESFIKLLVCGIGWLFICLLKFCIEYRGMRIFVFSVLVSIVSYVFLTSTHNHYRHDWMTFDKHTTDTDREKPYEFAYQFESITDATKMWKRNVCDYSSPRRDTMIAAQGLKYDESIILKPIYRRIETIRYHFDHVVLINAERENENKDLFIYDMERNVFLYQRIDVEGELDFYNDDYIIGWIDYNREYYLYDGTKANAYQCFYLEYPSYFIIMSFVLGAVSYIGIRYYYHRKDERDGIDWT